MEYEYICPKCGKIEKFKKLETVQKKRNNNEVCRHCKSKLKQESEVYSRECPQCGSTIYYKYRSDWNKAIKANSLCKHCCGKITGFQKEHNLNDIYAKRNNSLDRLIEDKSVQSFYWIGFILADGSLYENRFEFGLKESDKEVLEKFAEYIHFSGEIKHRDTTNSNRIYFSNSKSIPKFIEEYGLSYNKTYNPPEFSAYLKYSKDQLTALLIGLIDGDGCITLNGSEHSNAIIITAHKVWNDFYTQLLTYLSIPIHIKERKDRNILSIGIYQRDLCLKLRDFIKNNNLFHLKRKWEKIK